MRGYMHMRASALGSQRCQLLLELELQVVVSHSTWVLRTKLRPMARRKEGTLMSTWSGL